MDWTIENGRPIWLQLYEQLTLRIVTGQYPMGGKMPTVRELAAEAGVNPNTMQRALAYLEDQGLATSNRTAGRLVTDDRNKIQAVRMELARTCMDAYLQGMKVLGFTEAEARVLLTEGESEWKKI